jgi:hypothetical protein
MKQRSKSSMHQRAKGLAVAVVLAAAAWAAGCVVVDTGRPFGTRLPNGSYRESCRFAVLDGHRLKAQCRTSRGRWRSTSLDLRACNADIVNDDGHLRCGRQSFSRIPPGSYQRSCTDIRVRRGILRAECRDRKGRWRDAAAPIDACRRFANSNGRLGCEQ